MHHYDKGVTHTWFMILSLICITKQIAMPVLRMQLHYVMRLPLNHIRVKNIAKNIGEVT